MSLYLAPCGIDASRLGAVANELAFPGKSTAVSSGVAGFVWIDDDPLRFGPATDSVTGVTVVSSGRLVWPAQGWARAARLPYEGGLANRLILERYLKHGCQAVTPYNGAAVICLYDPRAEIVHLWTDQFGYHPCFLYRGDSVEACIITTFPDALLADPSVDVGWDVLSMSEFLSAWRATPPNTYFSEVKHAGAATHTTIDLSTRRITSRTYWKPFEEDFFPTISAATEELARAIKGAVAERTAVASHPLLFLSGGADSRVILYSASDRNAVTGVNLYEHNSLETEVARQLCLTAGARFLAIQRDADFYPSQLANNVRWSGGMWSAEDSHYLGFADLLAELSPDLVMTGCTTDWLFKGYGLEKRYVSLLGRNLPLFAYTDVRTDAFLPNAPRPSPPHLHKLVTERMASWFDGCPRTLATPRDRLLVEDRRVRPTAYAVSVSGSMMYRTYPYDAFLADSRVAACYSRVHPDWKLNRRLWGQVAARLCPEAGGVVDANFGWRVNAPLPERLSKFTTGWFSRRLRRPQRASQDDDNRPPSSGSWPDLGWYAVHSATLRSMWHSATPEERERITDLSGTDPWQTPLPQWGSEGPYLFRILTLLSFWRECAKRRERGRSPRAPTSMRNLTTSH